MRLSSKLPFKKIKGKREPAIAKIKASSLFCI